jgi:RIO-like serine/threonine protein kinase
LAILTVSTSSTPILRGECIGEGREGRVFEAVSPTSGKKLALKERLQGGEEGIESAFERESRMGSHLLSHPNFVPVLSEYASRSVTESVSLENSPVEFRMASAVEGMVKPKARGFIVMPKLDGKSLEDTRFFPSIRYKFKIAEDFIKIHQHLLDKGLWNFDLTAVNFIIEEGSLIAIDLSSFNDIADDCLETSASIYDVSMLLFEILSKRPRGSASWDHAIAESFGALAHAPLKREHVPLMYDFLDQASKWILHNTAALP